MFNGPYQRLAPNVSPLSWQNASLRVKQFIGTGRRRLIVICVSLFLLLSISFIHPTTRRLSRSFYYDLPSNFQAEDKSSRLGFGPPTWARLKEWEDELPQHNLDLPFPEGRTGRYVKFSNQIKMLGWNNVFNELLMNSLLAYKSKRAYVFQDYVWKPEYYSWPQSESFEWPPHTPLNAIIAGPTAGGLWDPGDDAPRSVSEKWFDVVCPREERRILNTREVKPDIAWLMGDEIFEAWRKVLTEAPERCIEIVPADDDNFPQTFDLWLWGSFRVLPLWKPFSESPISRLLATSPIVNSAVDRNEYLFLPHGPRPAHPVSHNPYDRMLAMHVRRGDFKDACIGLATWNSTYYSWNLLDFLPDHFEPPAGGSWGWNTPENTEKYMEHCLPTFDGIVKKVKDSKEDYIRAGGSKGDQRTLDVLYLLTNEESEWLEQLKDTLRKDGWHTIKTSRDLTLDQEQTDVNMAVDMDIARRAAVFIGNGWSSFTSNIVHRRLADGKEPISIRFY
ncbi:hypothetical protein C8R41DRAFT_760591 [Lentinula lateritia]|uniref:Uncharacterized protein n=1 Tax=Lentinula lateritia TaxID=40482 RepID=A0ABQ8VQU2_9AGAR|nr:hypothetical protein C8R41DRAFT_760591 [Lentinula lateritia]